MNSLGWLPCDRCIVLAARVEALHGIIGVFVRNLDPEMKDAIRAALAPSPSGGDPPAPEATP